MLLETHGGLEGVATFYVPCVAVANLLVAMTNLYRDSRYLPEKYKASGQWFVVFTSLWVYLAHKRVTTTIVMFEQ